MAKSIMALEMATRGQKHQEGTQKLCCGHAHLGLCGVLLVGFILSLLFQSIVTQQLP